MKILILDGYTLFQEDIAWTSLNSFGDIVFHERTSRENLSSLDKDVDVLITNKALVGNPELEYFKQLKLVVDWVKALIHPVPKADHNLA